MTPIQPKAHPLLFVFVPSSQTSATVLNPSPQIAPQVVAVIFDPPVHVHPVAAPVLHPTLQPIPSSVPSSQVSIPTLRPSPQIGVQTLGTAVVHEYPVSIVLQLLLQPSLLTILPSSQASAYPTVYRLPFPHTAQLVLPTLQYELVSIVQVAEQPSLLKLLASSHDS